MLNIQEIIRVPTEIIQQIDRIIKDIINRSKEPEMAMGRFFSFHGAKSIPKTMILGIVITLGNGALSVSILHNRNPLAPK